MLVDLYLTDWNDYVNGFGSVYGEYWLGLDTVRWLTHSRIYKLMFIFEDWDGTVTHANYDEFLVYGQEYVLSVSILKEDCFTSHFM